MFKFALVVLLCVQAYARPKIDIESHVVGGTPAKEGQFPFIVSLKTVYNFTFCGGALISDRFMVTAAHCVGPNCQHSVNIGAGSVHLDRQKSYDIEKVIRHPLFDEEALTNDIALLKLKTPVKIGGNIQTINFPTNDKLDGKPVTGLGWGRTSIVGPLSTTLLYLNRPILDNASCAKSLNKTILSSQICLEGKKDFGMCFGDSGSPLLYKGTDGKNYIAGVVSWGIPCGVGKPDVFTRVSSYTGWIKQNMV